ncbi:MAG: FAD-dependent oxidoreductase [Selenomonadaceae bacterium]|nr:FAD-dependent oxidoreductase [Selenomonadaceae bacterium]
MKYLILGAGVAGLTFANRIKKFGKNSFLVLEKENEVGGLCRSVYVDNTPVDIGGGHILDVRRPNVTNFIFEFMPKSEFNFYVRDSRINLGDVIISHPLEANIWQFPIEKQVDYLESIAKAGCNVGEKMPEKFVDWIRWKLGDKIAEDYMIPYNKKMFGENLNELGTYWLEKLPQVNFRETLLSCLTKKFYGKQPGHVEFFYPKKFGCGEIWRRMAENISSHIECGKKIFKIDFNSNTVTTDDGGKYRAEKIITTIPWREFKKSEGMPADLINGIQNLKHTAIQVKYFPENLDAQEHWAYFPNPKLTYHRIFYQKNLNSNWRGYWTETRAERVEGALEDRQKSFLNEYAYPLNTLEKPQLMAKLLAWCREKNVYGLGRWGEHNHYNSDLAVELAMKLAEEITN